MSASTQLFQAIVLDIVKRIKTKIVNIKLNHDLMNRNNKANVSFLNCAHYSCIIAYWVFLLVGFSYSQEMEFAL